MSFLSVIDGSIGYYGCTVASNLNFALNKGEFWAIVGRNGSGKSTLVKSLLKQIPLLSGTLNYKSDLKISYVPQQIYFSSMVPARVKDICVLGVSRKWGFLRKAIPGDFFYKIKEELSLEKLWHTEIKKLSLGQLQRVLIAYALVSEPEILLLDEPTSAMDPIHEMAIFDLLIRLQKKYEITIMVASHHAQVIPSAAEKVIFLDSKEKKLFSGTKDEVLSYPNFIEEYGSLPHCPVHQTPFQAEEC